MTTPMPIPTIDSPLTTLVREKYGDAARRVLATGEAASCCGPVNSCCGGDAFNGSVDPITSNLYVNGETDKLPSAAVLASLGCGNPTALAELNAGDVVLDLGSGGGIDVILSARRVGPTGKAYGLDMTDDMLALARQNAAEAKVENVEFLKGQIEAIPLPDNSVDVIISNCVINLSGDKRRVLAEAFRVLKPGGRFAVSDVVTRGAMPDDVRRNMELWVGCVAGALEESEFHALLTEAGFTHTDIEPTRIYKPEDAVQFLTESGLDTANVAAMEGKIMAAFVRATKPAAARASMRAATVEDTPAILQLLTGASLPVDGVTELLASDARQFIVASAPDFDATVVAVAGLEVCGNNALLRSVAVRADWQRHGLGHQLVQRVVCEAEARGIHALYLLTMTAEHYFPRFGFETVTRDAVPAEIANTLEFRSACPASATAMARKLGATARLLPASLDS
ncbi:arsenic resistance N-acetyltransferase ArsN2 [Gemmatimonas sp.]|uniref:arsenic resistance N-acetyltransferase ArsN2 n=1 Tax=Gemmatimonas sp. TaxID=1962908 RepID=UPI00286DF276|nr:arsenic resistance N-acetyltransferase ArsN2 [Gemmatimonas sp.]